MGSSGEGRRGFWAAVAGWLLPFFRGTPHVVVHGMDGNPYLLRWFLVPRNRWFNVYLHCFVADDDDRALHDHPWPYLTVILRRGYLEVTARDYRRFLPGMVQLRPATHAHRVVLFRDPADAFTPLPAWTLFVTGPKVRSWGFWCRRGWVHWAEFAGGEDKKYGRAVGCGEADAFPPDGQPVRRAQLRVGRPVPTLRARPPAAS